MDKRQATEFLGYLLRDKNIERTIYEDALKIAIESLKAQLSQEGTTKDATSDLISRQVAIDALKNRWKKTRNYEGTGDDIAEECELYLKQLPSAQPDHNADIGKKVEAEDCISRQEAIDALDKQIKQCCKALGSLCLSDVDKHAVEVEVASLRAYRGMLENLPTIQPEPKWIPVSERLPKKKGESFFDGMVLTTLRDTETGDLYVLNDNYCGDGNWLMCLPDDPTEVIAWMPLPEPYKPNNKQSGKERA